MIKHALVYNLFIEHSFGHFSCSSFAFSFLDNSACSKSEKLSHQELGVAKLSGFREWLSLHPLLAESDGAANSDLNVSSNKMIIFAHHHKVLDGVQVNVSLLLVFC